METIIKEVSPIEAIEMLKKNVGNRKLSKSHVGFLLSEMNNNNWIFDGQPIRLDKGGRILDGQHRLTALSQSDKPRKFLIVKGIDVTAFKVMDTGKGRSAGDVLGIKGFKSANHLAAAVKIIMQHNQGRNGVHRTDGKKSSNSDVLSFIESFPELIGLDSECQKNYLMFNKIISRSTIWGFTFLMSARNVTDSSTFWDKLCSGENLEKGDPIKVLRECLIKDKMSKSNLPFQEKKALIFKGWNHFRKGTKGMKYLRWNKREDFPILL